MADDPLPLSFNDNGTIGCQIGDTRHHLRRPKFGQLRDFWEAWTDLAADQDDLVARYINLEAEAEQAVKDNADGARRRLSQVRKDLRRERFALWAPWVRDVFTQLSDARLPDDDDDLEAWLLTAGTTGQFVGHWQSAPKASG